MHEREREFKCELKAGLWRMAMGQVILPPFRGGCTWYPGWEKTRTGPTRHSCNEHRNSSPRRNTRWKLKSFCHQPTNWSVPSWENNSLTLYYETKVSATIFAARFAFIQENLVVSISPASNFKSTLWSIDGQFHSKHRLQWIWMFVTKNQYELEIEECLHELTNRSLRSCDWTLNKFWGQGLISNLMVVEIFAWVTYVSWDEVANWATKHNPWYFILGDIA